jgi:hypothetical protein
LISGARYLAAGLGAGLVMRVADGLLKNRHVPNAVAVKECLETLGFRAAGPPLLYTATLRRGSGSP